MDGKLAKCARCERLFTQVVLPICPSCEPAELADYEKIRNALQEADDLSAQDLAERAEVDVKCVLRMLEEGHIDNASVTDGTTCGRCGAPAVSRNIRLCQACLSNLDLECVEAMRDLREALLKGDQGTPQEVRKAVEEKRRPSPDEIPPPASPVRRRMAARERRGKH